MWRPQRAPRPEAPPRVYRYYDLVMVAFAIALVCSNIIGAPKIAEVGGFRFGTGVLFFPISYVFGDVLTEVYGYARARRVVWAGFGGLIFAAFMSTIVVGLPPAHGWDGQPHIDYAFGSTPRLVLASLVGFLVGEFSNSVVLAKMKVRTEGRHLWLRTIGSTLVGEGVDTLVFYPLAFAGTWSPDLLVTVMMSNYVVKVLWEVVATPITYRLVAFLKRAEGEDYYDRDTNFTPFSLRV